MCVDLKLSGSSSEEGMPAVDPRELKGATEEIGASSAGKRLTDKKRMVSLDNEEWVSQ